MTVSALLGVGLSAAMANADTVLTGTINNTGNAINVPASPGAGNTRLEFATIVGGRIDIATGNSLIIPYPNQTVLDGVELNGFVDIREAVQVSFPQGQIFGNATIRVIGPALEGPTVLSRGFVGSPDYNAGITVASSVNLTAYGNPTFSPDYLASGIDAGTGVLTNHGTLSTGFDPLFSAIPQNLIVTTRALTLTADTVQNAGTLRAVPKADIDVYGTLALESSGVVATSRDANGVAGLINVHGDLDLTALSDSLVVDSWTGSTGATVITFTGARVGTFDAVTPGYQLIYQPHAIQVIAVPEPATAVALGGLAVTLLRRPSRRERRV